MEQYEWRATSIAAGSHWEPACFSGQKTVAPGATVCYETTFRSWALECALVFPGYNPYTHLAMFLLTTVEFRNRLASLGTNDTSKESSPRRGVRVFGIDKFAQTEALGLFTATKSF